MDADVPGDVEEDEYEEVYQLMPQGDENDDLKKNDEPIYSNPLTYVNLRRNSRRLVYGEVHYSATGTHYDGKWNPSFLKGISSYPPDTDIQLDEFLKNYEDFVSRINNTPADQREPEHVQFLLHTVLPDLENKLTESGITLDNLRVLLKLSCMNECSLVTRYALHMILETFSKKSYSTGGIFNEFIVQCESSLKDSILGQEQEELSTFDHENAEDQGLRIFVYSRVLMILYASIIQGLIPAKVIFKNSEIFNNLVKKLTNLQDRNFFVEKDYPRYAICCINETVERFSEKKKKKKHDEKKNLFPMFLTWLHEYNRLGERNENKQDEGIRQFISKIKTSKKGWFDFHVALFCLSSQIHEKPNNVEVLKALVDKYLKKHSECAKKWSSEGEWQTGLVLSSGLEFIVNNNQDKDTRSEACLLLIHCITKLTNRNSLEKLWVHKTVERCLFGPDRDIRQKVIEHLENEKGREERTIPISCSIEYLEQRYKKQFQPRFYDFIGMNNLKGYYSTRFRGEMATVKILVTSTVDIALGEKEELNKIHKQLVIEAYTLRRLNSKPHPNILRVFAYDTSAQPYHLITEQVSKGSLLQFLHSSRYQPGHIPKPSALIKMIFGVMDAVIYLNNQHLVHLAIKAANVLVGQDNVCKLTGFQFAREMTRKFDGSYMYESNVDEMAIRHAAPECFISGQFTEASVSWAIGIMLFEMHTYGVSPYNQYSNDEHDQIRRHVISGGELKLEDCITDEVCEVMQMCLGFEREKRPTLVQLKMQLETTYELLINKVNEYPTASYPYLTKEEQGERDEMNTSMALEKIDKQKCLGFLGSIELHDGPTIRLLGKEEVIRELVPLTKKADLERLRNLKHPYIVNVINVVKHDRRDVALLTEYLGYGNLLQVPLAKQCRPETLVTFAAQIAQAMRYMHDNDMIHSDLRAEHIMVFPSEGIKVSRLGRSKSVGKMLDMKCSMPKDATRWSPPEVIKHSIYSHSSDVYSFGIMCLELFKALSAPEGSKPEDVKPFPTIKDEQILNHLEHSHRPQKPELMPMWIYIVVKQCLLHKSVERPPFVLIEDALTYRKPFESCLLSYWKNNHASQIEFVDVSITQPEFARHLIPDKDHKTPDELRNSAAVEVFMKHDYVYVPMKPGHAVKLNYEYEDIDNDNWTRDMRRQPMKPLPSPSLPLPPPPPPPDSSEKIPVQESAGVSTLSQGHSELALYASTPNIYKALVAAAHEEDEVKAKEVPSDCPSLPTSPIRGQQSNDKESIHSITSSDESSEDVDTSSYPKPVTSDIGNQQYVHTMVADEGPVGCLDKKYECISPGSNHPEAEELSYYSITPSDDQQQNDGSSSPEPNNSVDIIETDRSTPQSPEKGERRIRPVPKPRKK